MSASRPPSSKSESAAAEGAPYREASIARGGVRLGTRRSRFVPERGRLRKLAVIGVSVGSASVTSVASGPGAGNTGRGAEASAPQAEMATTASDFTPSPISDGAAEGQISLGRAQPRNFPAASATRRPSARASVRSISDGGLSASGPLTAEAP